MVDTVCSSELAVLNTTAQRAVTLLAGGPVLVDQLLTTGAAVANVSARATQMRSLLHSGSASVMLTLNSALNAFEAAWEALKARYVCTAASQSAPFSTMSCAAASVPGVCASWRES